MPTHRLGGRTIRRQVDSLMYRRSRQIPTFLCAGDVVYFHRKRIATRARTVFPPRRTVPRPYIGCAGARSAGIVGSLMYRRSRQIPPFVCAGDVVYLHRKRIPARTRTVFPHKRTVPRSHIGRAGARAIQLICGQVPVVLARACVRFVFCTHQLQPNMYGHAYGGAGGPGCDGT